MSIFGKIVGAFGTHTTRRLAGKERSLANTQAQTNIDQIQRQRSAFSEDVVRNRAQLNQNLAARGVANSSIATQDKAAYERGAQRQFSTYDENLALAEQGQNVNAYKYVASKRMKPLQWMDTILEGAQEAGGAAMGFGGGAEKAASVEPASSAVFNLR